MNLKWNWRFDDYVLENGTKPISDWYEGLQFKEKTDFTSLMIILKKMRIWPTGSYRNLTGKKYDGLGEIKFSSCKKEHRVIGCFMLGQTFVFLIGCSHKQDVYAPANALDTAVFRYEELKCGKGLRNERSF